MPIGGTDRTGIVLGMVEELALGGRWADQGCHGRQPDGERVIHLLHQGAIDKEMGLGGGHQPYLDA